MNKGILKQAENRLAAASKKAAAISHSRSNAEIMEIWSEFLTEQQRFFNRLGNAAETNSERGWFERALAARNQDPVMLYLYQARNADEHGRSSIASVTNSALAIRGNNGDVFIEDMVYDHEGRISGLKGWEGSPGNPIRVEFIPSDVEASIVENRSKSYSPPPGLSKVTALAPLGVRYMRNVLREAVSFNTGMPRSE
ncbi:hypothetical protein [Sphingomonas sp. NFX23]|uniref:hypothetical protein n=1 Tax=Sphingomonas sp. NFX23 TaxID=2819532 RepID=UPI003CF9A26F